MRTSPVRGPCGTYGCMLPDRHAGLHATAFDGDGRASRTRTRTESTGVDCAGVDGIATSETSSADSASIEPPRARIRVGVEYQAAVPAEFVPSESVARAEVRILDSALAVAEAKCFEVVDAHAWRARVRRRNEARTDGGGDDDDEDASGPVGRGWRRRR
jgi:hypothetical protein